MAPEYIYFAAHQIRTNAVHIMMILDIATSAWTDWPLLQGYICSFLVMAPECIYFATHKIRTNAVHIAMILDIATSAWLVDFCHKTTYVAFW